MQSPTVAEIWGGGVQKVVTSMLTALSLQLNEFAYSLATDSMQEQLGCSAPCSFRQ